MYNNVALIGGILMAKIGIKKGKTVAGAGLGLALLKIVGVGLAGGLALIGGANKAGEKFLNEEKIKKLK